MFRAHKLVVIAVSSKRRSVVFKMGFQFACVVAIAGLLMPMTRAQDSLRTYRIYTETFDHEQPVTDYKWEETKEIEKTYKKKMVPVYQTETVEQKSISYRPITKKTERVERYKELEPVTVTKYRERKTQETSYDTVTEMRDEQYVTRRPVKETVMRDQQVTVRKKVTETAYQVKDETTLNPNTAVGTEFVPANVLVPSTSSNRPRVTWLRPGYYTDPVSGLTAWRRRGLHWAIPNGPPAASVVPALVPQLRNQSVLVPEVTRKVEPIEITRYVDQVETRKVPIEVERMEEKIETRKVPVQVRKPKQITRVERIPYTETTYREVERVRRIPVVEETMEKVETIEPIERTTAKWIEKEEVIQTPKIVRRRVPYTRMKKVPYTVKMRVEIDRFGNTIGEPEPVDPKWKPFIESVRARKAKQDTGGKPAHDAPESILENQERFITPKIADSVPSIDAQSKDDSSETSSANKTSARTPTSILVPETKTNYEVTTRMKPLGGAALKVETSANASTQMVQDQLKGEFVSPGEALNRETNLKPAASYEPGLIKRPAPLNFSPTNSDSSPLRGMDHIESLQRKNLQEIY